MDTEVQITMEEASELHEEEKKESLWKRITTNIVFQVVSFLVISFLEFAILELFFDITFTSYSFLIICKNVILIMVVNLILTGIFHELRRAMLVSTIFFLIVGVANYFVMSFRGYGIVFMDFYAVKTAATVAGAYSYHITLKFFAAFLADAALIAFSFFLPPRQHRYFHSKFTLISLIGIAVSALFLLWINFDTVFFKDVSSLTWDHNIGMKEYGYVLYFSSNAGKATVKKPEGYSPEKVEDIMSQYDEEPQLFGEEGKKQNPNLIMIMNESFSDLNVLGKVQTNKEVLSFYNSLSENVIKGYAQSSVYGGYTANSEFEFLTGCTKSFLPGNPYLQYVDDYLPTLMTMIKKQEGYNNYSIAMHPYHGSGYNRNRVYPLLGFDRFFTKDDFSEKNLVRNYVGDKQNYEKIIELYKRKKKGSSLCLFNVTMQNHNPYNDDTYTFKKKIRVTNFPSTISTNQYLSLMKMSDDALKELITFFKKEEEPTMIVLFGDHQPHLQDSFYKYVTGVNPVQFDKEKIMKEHTVPFMIWANYDIPEQNVEKISLNYLSSLVLKTAGLKMSNYNRYLLHLQETLPSISATGYYDKEGKLHTFDEENGKYEKELLEYEMIQYNYLFDKKNRLTRYFDIES